MRPRHLHFIGICGKGMGPIAHALTREGWSVTGSDDGAYPPMSNFLRQHGIAVPLPYAAANIPAETDLVVVGKRVREDNPELKGAIARGLRCCSFPVLLRDLFLERSRNAVVAGGLGKTTTTAMLAWILEAAGRNPDYLIGGFARNFAAPARLAGAEFAVIEGDEYPSCFDDPQAKFMHYRPEVVAVTNIVEDHPDIYPDIRSVEDVFRQLVQSIPRNGHLVIPDDDHRAMRLAAAGNCASVRTGFSSLADERITNLEPSPSGSRFRLGGTEFILPLCGRMNVRNAAMAAVAAARFGVSYLQSAEALGRFAGVHNRQQSRALGEYTLVVDKASHPIALRALFEATRQEHPRRSIVSVIQPRATGGRNWVYQQELPAVLADADRVVLLKSYEHNPEPGRVWAGGQFSTEALLAGLAARDVPVAFASDKSALPEALRRSANPGDVIVVSVPEQATDLLAAVEMTLMEDGTPRESGSFSAGRSPAAT